MGERGSFIPYGRILVYFLSHRYDNNNNNNNTRNIDLTGNQIKMYNYELITTNGRTWTEKTRI